MEAWIAVDPDHAVLMDVPPVEGRSYAVQILDSWGEVIANVDQRNYPHHPYGQVAFVLAGTSPRIPDSALHRPACGKGEDPGPGGAGRRSRHGVN